jgi:hypothetical protein
MVAVALLDPKVEIGAVTISWELGEQPDLANKELARIERFVLERRVEGGEWKKLADVGGADLSYVDGDIERKTSYEYRLTPVTSNEKWINKKGKETGETAGPVRATTRDIFEIRIINAVPPTVYVEVIKFEAGTGMVRKSFLYHPGDKIGFDPKADESVHTVPVPGGRAARVDFNTGYTLTSVEDKKLTLERVKCNPKYDDKTGMQIGCDQAKEPYPFTTTEVVYTDEEGKQTQILIPEPRVRTNLCPIHKPRTPRKVKKGATEEKGVEEKKGETGKKAGEPTDAAEDEVVRLMSQAEVLWKEGKKSQAVQIYKEIIDKHSDTEAYGRIKTLLKNRIEEAEAEKGK